MHACNAVRIMQAGPHFNSLRFQGLLQHSCMLRRKLQAPKQCAPSIIKQATDNRDTWRETAVMYTAGPPWRLGADMTHALALKPAGTLHSVVYAWVHTAWLVKQGQQLLQLQHTVLYNKDTNKGKEPVLLTLLPTAVAHGTGPSRTPDRLKMSHPHRHAGCKHNYMVLAAACVKSQASQPAAAATNNLLQVQSSIETDPYMNPDKQGLAAQA